MQPLILNNMKVEITPEKVEAFNDLGKPALCSISKKNICFSSTAKKLLAIQDNAQFLLEFEDGQLYYKDAEKGFKLSKSGRYGLPMAVVTGIGAYLETFFKKGYSTYRFEIDEFKDGRRKLILIHK